MGKKITEFVNGLIAIAKAMPLALGATAGIWYPTNGGNSPLQDLKRGDWNSALGDLTTNYTFYSNGNFESTQGRGIKILTVGIIAHKLIGWLYDA